MNKKEGFEGKLPNINVPDPWEFIFRDNWKTPVMPILEVLRISKNLSHPSLTPLAVISQEGTTVSVCTSLKKRTHL
jgi:hypothetical protein